MTDRFMRIAEVASVTGLSRPTIYRKIRDEEFPRQKRLTLRCVAWRQSEIESWMRDRFDT